MRDRRASALLLLRLLAPGVAQKDTVSKEPLGKLGKAASPFASKRSPQEWYCAAERSHSETRLCRRFALAKKLHEAGTPEEKKSIMSEMLSLQQEKKDPKAAFSDLDNPERAQMMQEWCAASLSEEFKKAQEVLCFKHNTRRDFAKRRDLMIQHWCVDQGHADGPKCLQLSLQKNMSDASTPEARAQFAAKFRAASMMATTQKETSELLASICSSEHKDDKSLAAPCAKTTEKKASGLLSLFGRKAS